MHKLRLSENITLFQIKPFLKRFLTKYLLLKVDQPPVATLWDIGALPPPNCPQSRQIRLNKRIERNFKRKERNKEKNRKSSFK